jgi:predicted MPP superfamily phosphohydrolase
MGFAAAGFIRGLGERALNEQVFEALLASSVFITAAAMALRRSFRSGLVVLGLYGLQGSCLIWASRATEEASWAHLARWLFLTAMVAVLAHRMATYSFTRPPLRRDQVIVPLIHVAQGWLFLELFIWPIRALLLPVSQSLDAWAVAGPLAFSAISLPWTHRRPRITRLRVPVSSLRRPLRVVHLSDLHLGPYLRESRLSWLADTVASERGDVIALTGDFLTLRTLHDWSPLLRFVETLQASEGTYACLGNHDVAVADKLSADLNNRGVRVLRDELIWLNAGDGQPPLAIAGLDWQSGRKRRDRYAHAFSRICDLAGAGGPAVVLCHQPAVFRLAPPGFGGIMLSGHLHGGQVGFTWGATGRSVLRLFRMYDQGLFARGKAKLYSHRGTGVYGFPLRIGVPAEIAVLDLVPEPDAS